ncbi:hypothetical protein SY2F82_74420 [Streptomyces sp. Y2F8-2]|uniref:hypothetical protein n=1 Tax=Streptomyces sp. Y2F8-2 TaxID=2759675 RepID=UPI001906569A|nr:hypothetical protein [Streptomyces sp. Y2F8-2]GHK05645.1 hypothetical protein SY2F82_74420 [Streptomyces sp. Y2F8-2]
MHAGTGDTLAEACAPRFLTTPAGRVSLVSVASRFEAMSRAADPLSRVPGRPGVNALRTTRYVAVPAARLHELALIRDALPPGSVRACALEAGRRDDTVTLFGTRYYTLGQPARRRPRHPPTGRPARHGPDSPTSAAALHTVRNRDHDQGGIGHLSL